MDYVQITDDQRTSMLEAIGADSIDDLFTTLPESIRLDRPLDLPPALSELELQNELARLAGDNQSVDRAVCFAGGGAYDHFIPSAVDALASQGEFVTAYTPYQAEASQGSLQAFFEFQTQVARLAGLDIANASLYEGASAAAEAIHLALNVTGKRRVLVAATLHPHYRQVIATDLGDLPCEFIELPASDGRIDPATIRQTIDNDTACVVVQSPNVFGLIEPWAAQFEATHEQDKTLAIAVFHPVASALLKTPGACGADVAAGEGQPLGIPLQYGGPYVGLFAARQKLLRKMPGRLIGQTVDSEGRRSFCLTLQTREQHIRGAKATSNICTNQGLLAIRATIHLSAMGRRGLRQVAEQCYHKAHYAATAASALDGYELAFGEAAFFNEFLLNCPVDARQIVSAGEQRGLLPGVPAKQLGIGETNQLLVAVTEKRTKQQIDQWVDLLRKVG